MKKVTVKNVAEAQALIQQIVPATYTAENSSLALGAKAKDRIEWYNAENSSYCLTYKDGEPDYVNVFDADDEIIATITIDNNAEDTEEETAEVTPVQITILVQEGVAKELTKKLMANIATLSSIHTVFDDTYAVFDVVTKATVQIETSEETAMTFDEAYKKATDFFIVEDDGSNDDPEGNFLSNYDASIEEEDEDGDELIDEPEAKVEKIYYAKTYIGRESMRYSEKEFKSATAAYRYLKKKRCRYSSMTYWSHEITVWDGKKEETIYLAGETYENQEKATDPEIQALIDADDWESKINVEAAEAKHFLNYILEKYGLTLEELCNFLFYYYETNEIYFENAGARAATKALENWIKARKATVETEDYAVTPEAFEVAVQAEIENANTIQFDLQAANDLEEPADDEGEKIYRASTMIVNDYPISREKYFKTAAEAFKWLAKKAKHYAATTEWEQNITVWDSEADANRFGDNWSFAQDCTIYTNDSYGDGETTTNPDIQALIDERDTKEKATKAEEEKALAEEKARQEEYERAEATCAALSDEWSKTKKKLADLRRYRAQCKDANKKAAYDLKIAEFEEIFKPLNDKYQAAMDICLNFTARVYGCWF